MKKSLLLAGVICLVLAAMIDLLSFRPSEADTIQKLKSYVNSNFDQTLEKINNTAFKAALDSDQGNIKDLNLFQDFLLEFDAANIKLNIQQNGKEVFWTSSLGFNDICKNTSQEDLRIRMCLNLFDQDGKLYPSISKRFHKFHAIQIDYSEKPEQIIDFDYGNIPIKIMHPIRSKWIIGSLIFLYFIGCFLLFFQLKSKDKILLPSLLALRIVLYLLPLDSHYAPSILFNNLHGFSLLHGNIMDYLINSVLLWSASITIANYLNKLRLETVKHWKIAGLILSSIMLIIFLIFSTKNMIFHANLNFDFEDLSQLRALELICLLALTINGLSLFLFSQTVFNTAVKSNLDFKTKYAIYALAISGGTFLSWIIRSEIPIIWIFSFLTVMTILFDLFSDIKSKNITWVIWWMIIFSVFFASILYFYNMEKDLVNRSEFLHQSYHPKDESQLLKFTNNFNKIDESGALDEIIDIPENARYNAEDISDYIKYKSPQLEETDILIFPFDANGSPMASYQYDNLKAFQKDIQHNITLDGEWQFDPIQNRYWTKKHLDKQSKVKEIYFGFSPNQPDDKSALYPLSYIKEGQLVTDANNLSFDEKLMIQDITEQETTFFEGSKAFVVYQASKGVYLVSKKQFAGLIKPIALFSLVFSLLGILLIFVALVNSYLEFLPETFPLRIRNINSLRIRIQLVIIILIIVSFLGIAWVTVSFITNFIDGNENRIVESKILSVSKDMNLMIRDEGNFNEALQILNASKTEIEAIHQSNISIFKKDGVNVSNDGDIKLDFLPYYYFTRIKSLYPFTIRQNKDEPRSFFILNHLSNNDAIIGLENTAEVKASQVSLFDFLGSIVNVYVFLFLMAGAISIAVAKSISKPLTVLGDKMKDLKLGKSNERLEWKSNDEIGVLIENYNGMVDQLEDSAQVLAKTERDMAWREMAKQVAHEIKNPLTPMKLNVQFLEKVMKLDPEEIRPKIKRISNTLLEQINNLAEIADSFSNFAKLPEASNDKISLNKVVETIHDLFRKRDDLSIKLFVPIDTIEVYAHKNHLIRVLNNLLKNAIEAIPETKRGMIEIELSKTDKHAIICVSDNGTGIPEELHNKVFTPNFTTKNSGSGLGLAISSNMLDAFNGRIFFETEENIGTKFFIEIPLIRNNNLSSSEKRVQLD